MKQIYKQLEKYLLILILHSLSIYLPVKQKKKPIRLICFIDMVKILISKILSVNFAFFFLFWNYSKWRNIWNSLAQRSLMKPINTLIKGYNILISLINDKSDAKKLQHEHCTTEPI